MPPTTSAIPTQTPTATPAAAAPAQTQTNTADASQFGNYSEWAQQEMAKGFTPQQLQQTLAENNVQIQPTAPAAAAGGGNQPSWWEKLLPTAGGVLGGILGTATDVIDGPLGSIGGAAGGSALGQMLENKLTGKSVLQKNDLTSAVENGAGEAVGLGAGKVVEALGGGLVNAGAKAGEKVAQDAVDQMATKGVVDDATATQLNYGGISPKLAGELELGKGQQFVKSMGFDPTNPYDMGKVADSVGDINNVYDRALQASPDVKMGDFNTTVFNALKANGSTDLTNSPIAQAVTDFNKVAGVDANTAIPETMPATQVRQLQQAVGRQIGNTQTIINNAELNGTYNSEAQSNLKTLQDLYGQLGDKIKTPEVDSAIKNFQVTDADRQGLVAKYGDKLGNHVADVIGNAQSANDLLGPMQDLTKMGRNSRMAINDIENVTNSPRAVARAKFEANGGVAPAKTASGPASMGDMVTAAARATGHPAATIVSAANKIHEAGLTPTIAKGLGNIIKRTAPLIPPVTVAGSNIPNIAASSMGPGAGSVVPSSQGDSSAMQPGAPGAGGVVNPVNSVISTILQSLSQPGASLTPGYGSMINAVDTLAPGVQQNELAANAVNALPSTYANAGGAQGLGGGILQKIMAMVPGTAANTYQGQSTAAADQIAKVLGITPQAALLMFPQLAQTPGVAAPQQQATSGLVNTLTAGLPTAQ